MGQNERYKEAIVSLSPNEKTHEDYYLTVTHSGRYLFQTFGIKDTIMILYDADYNQLAYNDNSGSENNALFSYSLTSGQSYIVRVMLRTASDSGTVKLGITPVAQSYFYFEDLYNMDAPISVHDFTSTLKTTEVLTYTPTKTGNHTFKTHYNTSSRIDTCMYLIDPYEDTVCIFDDDSGGDLQAQISKDLIAGRTYFIIVAPYHFATVSGNIGILIYATP